MGNTILIAEDYDHYLSLLVNIFGAAGYKVFSARTCAEAIEIADKLEPDCFLLDYHLADGPADSVCRFVRSDPRLKKKPIVIWTGDCEQAEESFELYRVDAFLPKATPLHVLTATVRHHLRNAELKTALNMQSALRLDPGTSTVISGNNLPIILPQEQFRLLSLLVDKSPDFIPDEYICDHVLRRRPSDLKATIRSLVTRLRQNLGRQLARRIRGLYGKGWAYIPPRSKKEKAVALCPDPAATQA